MNPSEAIRILLDAGMTQKEVGAAVGAPQSAVSRILNGQMVPRWDLASRLSAEASKARRRQSRRDLRPAVFGAAPSDANDEAA